MIRTIQRKHSTFIYRTFSAFIAFTFAFSSIVPPQRAHAQTIVNLPPVGAMLLPSSAYTPVMIKGINIDPLNPLQMDFIIDSGDTDLKGEVFNNEATKLIKYFLASLTIKEEEMWVNLSPYEENRIIPEAFSQTEMGRDLLVQDYLLKQLTASLIYPEDDLGKKFWDRVYAKAQEQFGTTEIPMNTFNKVWIVPESAQVFEHEKGAFVVSSHLKVMLEEDYLALETNRDNTKHGLGNTTKEDLDIISGVSSEIIREILIPEIEHEVNNGETFANLRQIFNSMILATWYKQNLKTSLLSKVYVDQNKIKGVDLKDTSVHNQIYDQYIEAFKKGVYNYIKEDYDPATKEIIPRKYFSGGFANNLNKGIVHTQTVSSPLAINRTMVGEQSVVTARFEANGNKVQVGMFNELAAVSASEHAASANSSSPINRREFLGAGMSAIATAAMGSFPELAFASSRDYFTREEIGQRVLGIYYGESDRLGTAWMLNEEYALTANHLVDGYISYFLLRNNSFDRRNEKGVSFGVVDEDKMADLALLRINPDKPFSDIIGKPIPPITIPKELMAEGTIVSRFEELDDWSPKEEEIRISLEGFNTKALGNKKAQKENIGELILPAGSNLLEVRGRIIARDPDFFDIDGEFQSILYPENFQFSTLLTHKGNSGAAIFELLGKNHYRLAGTVSDITRFKENRMVSTPGHPKGYDEIEQMFLAMVNRKRISKMVSDFIPSLVASSPPTSFDKDGASSPVALNLEELKKAKTTRKVLTQKVVSIGMAENDLLKINQALDILFEKQLSQRRDAGGSFAAHSMRVALNLIRDWGKKDAHLIISAILHDTVEDTDMTFEDIKKLFGPDVERIVRGVTNEEVEADHFAGMSKEEMAIEEIRLYQEHVLEAIEDDEVFFVKASDLGDNALTISEIEGMPHLQSEYANRYLRVVVEFAKKARALKFDERAERFEVAASEIEKYARNWKFHSAMAQLSFLDKRSGGGASSPVDTNKNKVNNVLREFDRLIDIRSHSRLWMNGGGISNTYQNIEDLMVKAIVDADLPFLGLIRLKTSIEKLYDSHDVPLPVYESLNKEIADKSSSPVKKKFITGALLASLFLQGASADDAELTQQIEEITSQQNWSARPIPEDILEKISLMEEKTYEQNVQELIDSGATQEDAEILIKEQRATIKLYAPEWDEKIIDYIHGITRVNYNFKMYGFEGEGTWDGILLALNQELNTTKIFRALIRHETAHLIFSQDRDKGYNPHSIIMAMGYLRLMEQGRADIAAKIVPSFLEQLPLDLEESYKYATVGYDLAEVAFDMEQTQKGSGWQYLGEMTRTENVDSLYWDEMLELWKVIMASTLLIGGMTVVGSKGLVIALEYYEARKERKEKDSASSPIEIKKAPLPLTALISLIVVMTNQPAAAVEIYQSQLPSGFQPHMALTEKGDTVEDIVQRLLDSLSYVSTFQIKSLLKINDKDLTETVQQLRIARYVDHFWLLTAEFKENIKSFEDFDSGMAQLALGFKVKFSDEQREVLFDYLKEVQKKGIVLTKEEYKIVGDKIRENNLISTYPYYYPDGKLQPGQRLIVEQARDWIHALKYIKDSNIISEVTTKYGGENHKFTFLDPKEGTELDTKSYMGVAYQDQVLIILKEITSKTQTTVDKINKEVNSVLAHLFASAFKDKSMLEIALFFLRSTLYHEAGHTLTIPKLENAEVTTWPFPGSTTQFGAQKEISGILAQIARTGDPKFSFHERLLRPPRSQKYVIATEFIQYHILSKLGYFQYIAEQIKKEPPQHEPVTEKTFENIEDFQGFDIDRLIVDLHETYIKDNGLPSGNFPILGGSKKFELEGYTESARQKIYMVLLKQFYPRIHQALIEYENGTLKTEYLKDFYGLHTDEKWEQVVEDLHYELFGVRLPPKDSIPIPKEVIKYLKENLPLDNDSNATNNAQLSSEVGSGSSPVAEDKESSSPINKKTRRGKVAALASLILFITGQQSAEAVQIHQTELPSGYPITLAFTEEGDTIESIARRLIDTLSRVNEGEIANLLQVWDYDLTETMRQLQAAGYIDPYWFLTVEFKENVKSFEDFDAGMLELAAGFKVRFSNQQRKALFEHLKEIQKKGIILTQEEYKIVGNKIRENNPIIINPDGKLQSGQVLKIQPSMDWIYAARHIKDNNVIGEVTTEYDGKDYKFTFLDPKKGTSLDINGYTGTTFQDQVIINLRDILSMIQDIVNTINEENDPVMVHLFANTFKDRSMLEIFLFFLQSALFHEANHMLTIPKIENAEIAVFDSPGSNDQFMSQHEISGILAQIARSGNSKFSFHVSPLLQPSGPHASAIEYIRYHVSSRLGYFEYIVERIRRETPQHKSVTKETFNNIVDSHNGSRIMRALKQSNYINKKGLPRKKSMSMKGPGDLKLRGFNNGEEEAIYAALVNGTQLSQPVGAETFENIENFGGFNIEKLIFDLEATYITNSGYPSENFPILDNPFKFELEDYTGEARSRIYLTLLKQFYPRIFPALMEYGNAQLRSEYLDGFYELHTNEEWERVIDDFHYELFGVRLPPKDSIPIPKEVIKYLKENLPLDNDSNATNNAQLSSEVGSGSSPITEDKIGGIDLNPNNLDLQTQGGRFEFQLPVDSIDLQNIRIDGFTPVIINVAPLTNLPLLLGLVDGEQPFESAKGDRSHDLSLLDNPINRIERFKVEELESAVS